MTGSVALDVVIGLVFIYLLYSLLASLIQEIIATNMGFRAKILEKAIGRMLDDSNGSQNPFIDRIKTWGRLFTPFRCISLLKKDGFSEAFYKHSEIKYKSEDGWHSKPSAIAPENFSKVIVDLLRGPEAKAGDDFSIKIKESLENGNFREFNVKQSAADDDNNKNENKIEGDTLLYLKSLWADSQGDVEEFKKLLETWFDQMMDRTIGWYKKYNQVILLFVGLAIAITFNVDSILIVKKLSVDPELRSKLIAQADNFNKAHPNLSEELNANILKIQVDTFKLKDSTLLANRKKKALKDYDKLVARRDSLITKADSLVNGEIKNVNDLVGLGWSKAKCPKEECNCICFPEKNGGNSRMGSIVGWLLTALAISMGAPFWFDLLNKLMKLRSSVQSTTTSQTDKKRVREKEPKRVG